MLQFEVNSLEGRVFGMVPQDSFRQRGDQGDGVLWYNRTSTVAVPL